MKLANELVAGVFAKDFLEPAWVGASVLGGEDFDDVALAKLGAKIDHFAVNLGTSTGCADFAMKAIGEVEGHGAFREVDNVAFWRVDEDFVGKEVELELFLVDFFARSKFGGAFLELFDPDEIGGELTDATLGIGGGEFLFVVVEAGGETAFGVVVHFAGADLEFDNLLVGGDNGGV